MLWLRLPKEKKWKYAAVSLVSFALLTGFVAPQKGEMIELQQALLKGRSSPNFTHSAKNLQLILEPHTVGKVLEVRHFPSGNAGLLIDVMNGDYAGSQVWVHFDPHKGWIAICADAVPTPGARCQEAQAIAQARGIQTHTSVPTIPAQLGPPSSADSLTTDVIHFSNQVGHINSNLSSPSAGCRVNADGKPTNNACIPEIDSTIMDPNFGTNTHVGASAAQKRAFLAYTAPIAAHIQAATGIPASVTIAQAILETGWGRSWAFRNLHSLFGFSCSSRERGETRVYQSVRATCTRGINGYYYYKFAQPQDSAYAYIEEVGKDPYSPYRKSLDRVLHQRRPSSTAPASWQAVAAAIAPIYCRSDAFYYQKLKALIESNSLYKYDRRALCD